MGGVCLSCNMPRGTKTLVNDEKIILHTSLDVCGVVDRQSVRAWHEPTESMEMWVFASLNECAIPRLATDTRLSYGVGVVFCGSASNMRWSRAIMGKRSHSRQQQDENRRHFWVVKKCAFSCLLIKKRNIWRAVCWTRFELRGNSRRVYFYHVNRYVLVECLVVMKSRVERFIFMICWFYGLRFTAN